MIPSNVKTYDENGPARALLLEIASRMRQYRERAGLCLRQLNDSQVWQRLHLRDNAIGNLVLHLTGSLRQWVLGGVGGQSDERDRQAEFDAKAGLGSAALSDLLKDTVEACCRVIETLRVETVLEPRRIQDTDTTVASALVGAVSHLGVHVGQMQYVAKMLLGESYKDTWQPRQK